MLREANVHALAWPDKTMSVIRTRQLEACEQRLMQLPGIGLFGLDGDGEAERLWRISYDAQEHPIAFQLHTVRELQAQVIIQLPAEAALMTQQEEQLVERLLSLGGDADLLDWDEIDAAESLARRLWCTISRLEDRTVLHMAPELMTPLMLIMSSKQHEELRGRLAESTNVIRALLYLHGLLNADTALDLLHETVTAGTYADDDQLARRYLRNAFDCVYDDYGDMLLLHPGLADHNRLLHGHRAPTAGCFPQSLTDQQWLQASDGIMAEEKPLYDRMLGLLEGAVRPELTEQDAVEDLRMLAKQGVSLNAMNEVLSSVLIVQPTKAMQEGLKLLHDLTPRWDTMQTGVVS